MRLLCLAVALLAAALMPDSAMAGETVQTYALKLRGVQVTSENCSDIQFDQSRGKASYDPATKTLTLDNVDTNEDSQPLIYNTGIDGLTIKCKRSLWLDSKEGGFLLEANTTIDGSEAEVSYARYIRIGKGTTVTVANFDRITLGDSGSDEAAVSGVSGTDGETLVVRSSTFIAKGKIEKLAALETYDCDIADGAAFDASLHAVAANGEACSPVHIYKHKAFDLWIAGVQVTTSNSSSLSEIPGVSGHLSFYKEENTLYMNNCSITPEQGCVAIRSDLDEFSLVVQTGTENTVTANGAPAIVLGKDTYISYNNGMGYGKLTVTASGDNPAILAHGPLEFYGIELNASGTYGIEGGGDGISLSMSNSKARISGRISAMANITALYTPDMKITLPEGAAYDSNLRGVAKDGKLATDVTLDTMEEYDIQIGDYTVNEVNCADLSAMPCIDGKASYDPSTNTLTLDNASVDGCIHSSSKDHFTILVKGKCSIMGNLSMRALSFYNIGDITIKGDENAELTIDMPETDYTTTPLIVEGIIDESTVTIDNCDMDIKGDVPISCEYSFSDACTLRIVNSALDLHATRTPIYNFKALEMKGCRVASPEGLHYESPAFVREDGTEYKGEMTIVRDTANGIASAGTDGTTEGSIYTIGGTKIARSGGKLPKGINITGGKKKAVR